MEKGDSEGQNEETQSNHSRRSSKSSGRLTVRSSAACSSRSSASSRASMAVARAQAEAQAAKARLAYAEKEMSIKVEKARLEATLDVINLQKEADAAMAKAEVMESAVAQFDKADSKEELSFLPLQATTEQKVSEYINKNNYTDLAQGNASQHDDRKHQTEQSNQPLIYSPLCPKHEPVQCRFVPQDGAEGPTQSGTILQIPQQGLFPKYNADSTSDLARFLAKSQLVTGGLEKFDDKPESYLSWKTTFQSTITELGLTASGEMNLLIKWLGPESSEHAKRLKAVNIKYPLVGLNMIWSRLEECYGSPEAIENSLFTRIQNFPKLSSKEPHKLRDLSDLLCELQAAKLDGYLPGLNYLDTARGVHPIVEKLPFHLQEKWTMSGSKFKEDHNVSFPPFSFFVEFVKGQAKARNDPSFTTTFNSSLSYVNQMSSHRKDKSANHYNQRSAVTVHKVDISSEDKEAEDDKKQCPIHQKPHPLKKCRGFRIMPLDDRKKLLRENKLCFRCLTSTSHQAKDCSVQIKCEECDSERHLAALHPGPAPQLLKSPPSRQGHGGEQNKQDQDVTTTCTEVCGNKITGKSCSKICLVQVYPKGQREKMRRMYAMIDDQSNQSLAKTEFFDIFDIESTTEPYTLKTCSGVTQMTGRRAGGHIVESLDGKANFPLPTLIECNAIPNNRDEVPTAEAALHHPHLKAIAAEIPPLDPKADILLLIGRDLLRAHKVREQINGGDNDPFAQKLDLGWVIVGDVCLGNAHKPSKINVLKTHILDNGRPSCLIPCNSHLNVKEDFSLSQTRSSSTQTPMVYPHPKPTADLLGETVFQQASNDNRLAQSVEDMIFLEKMSGFFKDETNSWVARLPFRSPRRRLPDNRSCAYRRLMSLRHMLDKKPEMKTHFVEFMQQMFNNQHAELAPPHSKDKEIWYLPVFGVYHPQKPGKIRVVFDSSAQFDGVSLNDVLLSGPDLNNTLLGVLLCFRKEPVAVTANIEQMFYCFVVRKDHRDYLRFLWYEDNDLAKDMVDYRMRVHVFGNSPSPAVAIYGMRLAAKEAENENGADAQNFIEQDFYVDDALKSFPTVAEAVDVLKKAQKMLALSNLRLHKIASNKVEVAKAFCPEDRAKDIKNLDLTKDELPVQRSLGVSWNPTSDTFTFHVPKEQKPFTRRGVLSTVNSLFDPLGLLAPVTIKGRLLLRALSSSNLEWDSSLPQDMYESWRSWHESLNSLTSLHIPRTYVAFSISQATFTELCVFSDASVKAIAAVAYLKVTHEDQHIEVGFVMGKAKLAPTPESTIPRLELCAAVLAVEMSELLKEELKIQIDKTTFYTDSKVVLGYINNQSRRFHVYVNSRVQRIKRSCLPEQWRYVPTEHNPADHGSRSVPAGKLSSTLWFHGPAFLLKEQTVFPEKGPFKLIDPESDGEIRHNVSVLVTTAGPGGLGLSRFERFSKWTSLVRSVAYLHHIADSFMSKNGGECRGWHLCKTSLKGDALRQAEHTIIRCVQNDVYAEEINCIMMKREIPCTSTLLKLHPFMDNDSLLRVGGRLAASNLTGHETNPLLIPGKHHIATLLIRHHHEAVQHQGRHFTEGAVRAGGLWIVGAKRSISSVIHKCVTCRKLRGKMEQQIMSDLPAERLQTDPPFSYVGLDVFGPWEVSARRTKGGQANSKRWAVLFTCMSTRAIHIEVVETLSASSFIYALRRFFAIRGPAKQLRSDRGTNFVGAAKDLKLNPPKPDEPVLDAYLQQQRCSWVFNAPHSSHMGGTWERMIGISRRILDSMLLQAGNPTLTHEVLTTLMAEVTAIINARPLIPVSSDPDAPFILTPASLLTQKFDPVPIPSGDFTKADMYTRQWKRVQALADTFWARWQKDYLHMLQSRQKWQRRKPNLKEGNIVLLKDKQLKRNEWPMGIIVKTLPSKDGVVRKLEVKVARDKTSKTFCRPISDCILLLRD
nr:uncharacterized protein LOC129165413 [Nothobranchius furzeri]